MKKEIKRLWVEALRSGEYQQGKECLRVDRKRFCCLGVLTDLAVKSDVGKWDESFNQCSYYLPETVMQWAGLSENDPTVRYGPHDESIALAELNDNGASFSEIADAIERSL